MTGEPLVIEFTPDESERLRERARLHGYDDAAAYVRMALLDDEEDDDETILAGLRTGWTEVLRGEEGTLDELWEALREDE